MQYRLMFFVVAAWAVFSISLPGQVADPNPAHAPTVFLGNHRPNYKKDKAPVDRGVTGKVVDSAGQPLEGALVTITDTKTSEKWTIVTKKDGRYGFDGLSFTIDYGLQAKYHDLTSQPTKLSQYDHMAKAVRILEVGPPPADTEAKKEASRK